MAGYIFSLSKDGVKNGALEQIIYDGIYSTIIKKPRGNFWSTAMEATFGDYITMKEDDYVFFFSNRKVYGIGQLKEFKNSCIYKNYEESSIPIPNKITNFLIPQNDLDAAENYRWLCFFNPAPMFFKNGVDIDDILVSTANEFNIFRSFEKLSFIKIDENEAIALRDIILFRNRDNLDLYNPKHHYEYNLSTKDSIAPLISDKHELKSSELLNLCNDNDEIKHEMAIEINILEQISKGSCKKIGKWDYISHQVIASPFKPLIYVDKMDLFGYRYLYNGETISEYLVGEIKKDIVTKEDISQVMKYVDWVYKKYASYDYSRIKAYLIGYDFTEDALNSLNELALRQYRVSSRPPVAGTWSNLTLLKYRYKNNKIALTEINC